MDPLTVGALAAMTAALAVAFWQLLVRPETFLALWSAKPTDEWVVHHPAAVRALRYAAGTLLFLFALLTGLTVTFLLMT
jgi:hypothetical protein